MKKPVRRAPLVRSSRSFFQAQAWSTRPPVFAFEVSRHETFNAEVRILGRNDYECDGNESQMPESSVPRTQEQNPCRPRSLTRV